MTVRQVIKEIEALPPEQQREVFVHFLEKTEDANSSSTIKFLDRATAHPLIKQILAEHAELFQKLAQ